MQFRLSAITGLLSTLLLIPLLAIPTVFTPVTVAAPSMCATELFFSEYVEGSSFNKALEIYNGTENTIDLSTYTVDRYANGSPTVSESVVLAGSLAAGDVFIFAHTSADPAILAIADQTAGIGVNFNGDDAVTLTNNGAIVDVIGVIGTDPGTAWGSAPTTTANATLVRKSTITTGDTNGADAFDPATEWNGLASNTFDQLGAHTMSCDGGGDTIAISEVQFTEDVSGDSPLAGQEVMVEGIVYAVYPEGFAIADAAGAWNGIYVFLNAAPTNSVGDRVQVTGTVSEFFGMTQLSSPVISTIGNGQTPYAAAIVTTGEIATGGASAESYEGTFVEVEDVTVTNENPDDPDNFGEFVVDDGSGGVRVDDLGNATYSPTLDDDLTHVRGMLNYNFSNTKIEPRDDNDIGAVGGAGCGEAATLIHSIQGSGASSPIVGATDVIIEGVVVSDFQADNLLDGFHIQEEDDDADGDMNTSEGIFVYDPNGLDVEIGDLVRLQGNVIEFNGLTEINSVDFILKCAVNASALATPAAPMLPLGAVEDLEKYEGMSVTFPQTLYVTEHYNLGRYANLLLSVEQRLYQGTQVALPGAEAAAVEAQNALHSITLDDGSSVQNPTPQPFLGPDNTTRGGDTIDGLHGVIDYAFGEYRVHAVGEPTITRSNPRPTTAPDLGGRLKVGSFNVLNYFTTLDGGGSICGPNMNQGCRGADNATEFTRQRTKIVEAIALMDADVVGLIEIENHATDAALIDLVNGLNAEVGASTYDYVDTGSIGDDAIKVAFIYQPASVSVAGTPAILDSSVDPDFNDGKNRPALAVTFRENATRAHFTAVVNHFKSKGSSCDDVGDPDTGDGQGNCNLTRTAAAEAEAAWLATNPTGHADQDILILGDLNAYGMEDPILALEDAGYRNLQERFEGADYWSYVFNGRWGTLDYALANPSMNMQVTDAIGWHINADEPRILDYNTEFNPPELYSPDMYRASDHDPIVVGLNLNPDFQVVLPIVLKP